MNKKHILLSGSVGAAVAVAVVVTVYEGHVIADARGSRTELVAGTRTTIGPDGRAIVASATPLESGTTTPGSTLSRSLAEDASASREELLARTSEQRIELGKLRARLAELEERHPGNRRDDGAEQGRAWYDPSPERLAQWATECHIRADEPGFDRFQPWKLGEKNDRGIEPGELAGLNEAMAEVHKQWKQLVRALYLEATGDTAGADALSLDAMRGEIVEKSAPAEQAIVLQKLAQERAGLVPPPGDLSKTSPLERMMRAFVQLGDQTEAVIAKRLGPERAKEIRGDGWGSRSDWSGCPDPAH